MIEGILQDLRYALRQLGRSPGFTFVAVPTLALGIAGATTMFAFLQAVARHGQPTVPEPERIARLFTTIPPSDARGPVAFAGYRRLGERSRLFETLAAYSHRRSLLRTADGEEEISVLSVTPSYLSLLKTPPVAGRAFTADDARSADGLLAMLSERAWRSRFGSSPSVLGRNLDLEGKSYTVVGVLAERMGLVMGDTDLFVPLLENDESASVMVVGRRRLSASWAEVRAEMAAIGVGDREKGLRVQVTPILDDAGYRVRMLWLLAVGPSVLVLLIGSGNVASLLLVRAMSRERETAVRLALGASRRRLGAQHLIEGWTLTVFAGVLGFFLTWVGLLGIRALVPVSTGIRIGLDAPTLLFAGITTLMTPLVFGVAPLYHTSRVDLSDALRASLQRPLFGVGQYHLRDLLAVLEVALSVALVAFALTFLSLVRAMRSLEVNFDGAGLVVAHVTSPKRGPGEEPGSAGRDIPGRLRERVSAVPGVSEVTMGDLPIGGAVVRVGRSSVGAEIPARQLYVDPDYFETLRLPIVRGRRFDARDAQGSSAAAVVNESTAARLWPGTDPVGQALYLTGDGKTEVVTVVGVSKDAVRLGRLSQLDVHVLGFRYSLFRPLSPGARPDFDVIARVREPRASWFPPIRDAVHSVDRRLRLRSVVTMTSAIDPTQGQVPLPAYLLGGFGGLALLLAAIGVFGVMSQLVGERRVELGVRLALGASPRGLVRLVVREGLIRVGVGAGLGLIGLAVSVYTGFAGLLTAATPDPWLWVGVVAVIAMAAGAACYVPAHRAARLDPMVTLRSE